MIIGGATNEDADINYVMVYDIDYDIYTEALSHPKSLQRTTAINRDGYIYTFGGRNLDDVQYWDVHWDDLKTVARISLTLDKPWEILENMETSDYGITIIPYN